MLIIKKKLLNYTCNKSGFYLYIDCNLDIRITYHSNGKLGAEPTIENASPTSYS